MHFCITFCLAILLSSFQKNLLSQEVYITFIGIGFALILMNYLIRSYRAILVCIAGFLLGFGYANYFAEQRFQHLLPEQLEKVDIELQIAINSLVINKGRYQQFVAEVVEVKGSNALVKEQAIKLNTILLNWYGSLDIQPCDTWLLTVRLMRPHGLANPGSFDYEAYLFERGIQAKGYVRSGRFIKSTEGFCMQTLRQQWKDYVLSKIPVATAAWIVALSTGDKDLLSLSQRSLLAETGISHLFVISGLHIGLCAAVVYALIMGLRRSGLGLLYLQDWRPVAALLAILAAFIYAAFADFGIPSQRALIMLVVFMGGKMIGIRVSLWFRYWLAMSLVLLVNPLSALNVGFVLSFAAVFVLILLAETLTRKQGVQTQATNGLTKSVFWFTSLWQSQIFIFIGLLPFTLMYFSQVSLLAPLINIVTIPLMSFLVIPNILLALAAWYITGADFNLLQLASWQLEHLFYLISKVHLWASTNNSLMFNPIVTEGAVAVIFVVCFLLLMPRIFSVRLFAILLILAAMLSNQKQQIKEGELLLDVIDVGQGLSVLIQTTNHQLLYDVGAAWTDGSMVDMAVVPYLAYYGIHHLDKVIISHQDNDHAGGIGELLAAIKVEELISSKSVADVIAQRCERGRRWSWDGVEFEIIHPNSAEQDKSKNNESCVLLVRLAERTILLTGDIESKIEHKLLNAGLPAIDVLLAPHHGSKTSSSQDMVNLVGKGMVIFSSGYLNQFKHPHPDVLKRYQLAGAQLFNTALQGAIHLEILATGIINASAWREQHGRYWNKISRSVNVIGSE